jgi:hypothetical protein
MFQAISFLERFAVTEPVGIPGAARAPAPSHSARGNEKKVGVFRA